MMAAGSPAVMWQRTVFLWLLRFVVAVVGTRNGMFASFSLLLTTAVIVFTRICLTLSYQLDFVGHYRMQAAASY